MLKTVSAKRIYGIDLLRIICMLMIALLHVQGHGGLLNSAPAGTMRNHILWLLECGCYCAVNCYALISGYVGIHSRFRLSNLAALWMQVAFYSVGITLIFRLFVPSAGVAFSDILKSFMPVVFQKYWFFTAYIGMMLLAPLVNTALKDLSRKNAIWILGLLTVFFSVFPTFFSTDTFYIQGGYHTVWLLYLYYFGGCIQRYSLFSSLKKRRTILIYVGAVLFTWIFKVLVENPSTPVLYGRISSWFFVSYTSPTILISAIALVLFAVKLEFPAWVNKGISFMAPLSFGVYLIHDNPLVREHVIGKVFAPFLQLPSPVLPFAIFGAVMAIYIICSMIDFLRSSLFKQFKVKERLKKMEDKLLKE